MHQSTFEGLPPQGPKIAVSLGLAKSLVCLWSGFDIEAGEALKTLYSLIEGRLRIVYFVSCSLLHIVAPPKVVLLEQLCLPHF